MSDTDRLLTEQSLIDAGGSLWTKGSHRRVYFNNLAELAYPTLELTFYGTGNISSASLDGERISNSAAYRLLNAVRYSKVWWDSADAQFHGREISQHAFDAVVAGIKVAISA